MHLSIASCLCLLLATVLPYPKSKIIGGLELDWSTHQRFAQGSDNFQLTWADDDHLYGAWGDGGGFGGTNGRGRVSLGVARIESGPTPLKGVNVWGGHQAEHPATFEGKSWGMISVRGTLYMWVVPDKVPGEQHRNHYGSIVLATSSDHGATWSQTDCRFSQSDQLTVPTFLNFGRDNAGVPEAFGRYVYSYFVRPQSTTMSHQGPDGVGLIVHRPGVLYLARVNDQQLVDPAKYEFFCGLDPDGKPRWGDLRAKQPVFEDANGTGWCVSASFHEGLQRVLLCTEHGQSSRGQLGIFDAPTPWGPWTTVEYFEESAPMGHVRPGDNLAWKNNVFFCSFPTKWFREDRFTLSFTGAGLGKDNDSFNLVSGRFLPGTE